MYFSSQYADHREPLGDRIRSTIKRIKEHYASRLGISRKSGYSPHFPTFLGSTSLIDRMLALNYNLGSLNGDITIFTGVCLVKKDEDIEYPVTLEDAIECSKLDEVRKAGNLPVVCMYPDEEYSMNVSDYQGSGEDRKKVQKIAEKQMHFRGSMIPGIINIPTSEHREEIDRRLNELLPLRRMLRHGYYGITFSPPQDPTPMHTLLMRYGIATILLPEVAGYPSHNILVFAEPPEKVSVAAAEMILKETNDPRQIALLGQLPLPRLDMSDFGRNLHGYKPLRMFDAPRESRIHLNEADNQIRSKLNEHPFSTVMYLYMSSLTPEEMLKRLNKTTDMNSIKSDCIDLVMDQIDLFRTHLS